MRAPVLTPATAVALTLRAVGGLTTRQIAPGTNRPRQQATAARLYAQAARTAPNVPERDHLTRQAARLNARLRE